MKKLLSDLSLKNIALLIAAGAVNAVAVTMFLAPVGLYDSGFSGTAILLWKVTPPQLTLSIFLVVLNFPFFLYAHRKLGFSFTVYSLLTIGTYSAVSFLITNVLPIDVAASSPFVGTDLLLCAVFGGLLSGIGSGMAVRYGGAMDGVDAMASLFAKSLGVSVGTFVMAYNVVLYVIAAIVMRSWSLPLYSVLAYMMAIKTVDFITEGFDKEKYAMIICRDPDAAAAALTEAFGHGVTMIDIVGGYSSKEGKMLYFVVNRFQITKMVGIIRAIDPKAFVTISEVSDVMNRFPD